MGKMKYVWLLFAVGMAMFGVSAMALGVAVLVVLPTAELSFVELVFYVFGGVGLTVIGFSVILVSYEFLYKDLYMEAD